MALTQNCILNNREINHKIRRIAYQIYETNVNQKEVILAGIQSNGYVLAEKIKNSLRISLKLKSYCVPLKSNKKNQQSKSVLR